MGEGMMSVQDGQSLRWSHREGGAIGILADERFALFFWNMHHLGFS